VAERGQSETGRGEGKKRRGEERRKVYAKAVHGGDGRGVGCI